MFLCGATFASWLTQLQEIGGNLISCSSSLWNWSCCAYQGETCMRVAHFCSQKCSNNFGNRANVETTLTIFYSFFYHPYDYSFRYSDGGDMIEPVLTTRMVAMAAKITRMRCWKKKQIGGLYTPWKKIAQIWFWNKIVEMSGENITYDKGWKLEICKSRTKCIAVHKKMFVWQQRDFYVEKLFFVWVWKINARVFKCIFWSKKLIHIPLK